MICAVGVCVFFIFIFFAFWRGQNETRYTGIYLYGGKNRFPFGKNRFPIIGGGGYCQTSPFGWAYLSV